MRKLVLLLAVVGAGAGLWVMHASTGPGSAPMGPAGSPETEEPATGDGLQASTDPEVLPDIPVPARRTTIAAGAVDAKDLARIVVLDGATGDAVPGAEVRYYENFPASELDPEERAEHLRVRGDFEKLTDRYGARAVADADGVVHLPVEVYVRSTCRLGERYGYLSIRRQAGEALEDEYRLVLERDLTLHVQVLDALGAPAGGVNVQMLPVWEPDTARNATYRTLGTSEQGTGRLRVPHLQTVLARWKEAEPYPTGHLLRPWIPGLTEPGQPVDVEHPPVDPVVLRLPPTGRVEVVGADPSGRRVPADVLGRVQLAVAPGEPVDAAYVLRLDADERWSRTAEDDGVARFERVLTGLRLLATATLAGERVTEEFAGPAAQGQEVQLTLHGSRELYWIAGRILDPDRNPVAEARFRHSVRVSSGEEASFSTGGGGSLATDAEGRFRRLVQVGTMESPTLTLFTVEDPGGSAEARPGRMTAVPGPRRLVPGVNELGDLVLEEAPLVVAGRILVDGEPTSWNGLVLSLEKLEGVSAGRPGEGWWSVVSGGARRLEGGRFEFRGAQEPGRYRLSVWTTDQLPVPPVEFPYGADDVVIELESGGSLQASVLADDPLPADDLWLRLVPTSGQDTSRAELQGVVTADPQQNNRLHGSPGTRRGAALPYRWASLWPGSYRLEILTRGAASPLLQIDGVRVEAGSGNRDPRLEGIDLRGRLRRIEVRVLGTQDRPPQSSVGWPIVLIDDRSPGATLFGYTVVDGVTSILTAESYVDLLVVARGYRPGELRGVVSDTEVTLEPYPEVVIGIAGGLELPDGYRLRVRVTPVDREADQRLMYSARGAGTLDFWVRPTTSVLAFDGEGQVRVPVDRDGRHRLRLQLYNEGTRRSVPVQGAGSAEIMVDLAAGSAVYEIEVPEAALRDAVGRAGR